MTRRLSLPEKPDTTTGMKRAGTRDPSSKLRWRNFTRKYAPAVLIDRHRRLLRVQCGKKALQSQPAFFGKPKQSAYQVEKPGLFADI
jgi:hypothetical protein